MIFVAVGELLALVWNEKTGGEKRQKVGVRVRQRLRKWLDDMRLQFLRSLPGRRVIGIRIAVRGSTCWLLMAGLGGSELAPHAC
jgi:hypothetical protein